MDYPKGKRPNNLKHINYKNRGMTLERDINISNEYYRDKDIAYIYKKPTPIGIAKMDYKHGKIIEAYLKEQSTTDYNGLYDGYYIDFEAKETKTSSFPYNNIKSHQVKHLINIDRHKGISFIIIRFTKYNETYLLMTKDFVKYKENFPDKKSVPLAYFKEKAYLLKEGYNPRIDYLEVVKKIIGDDYEKKSK